MAILGLNVFENLNNNCFFLTRFRYELQQGVRNSQAGCKLMSKKQNNLALLAATWYFLEDYNSKSLRKTALEFKQTQVELIKSAATRWIGSFWGSGEFEAGISWFIAQPNF